jgi:hypothetical protein
MTPDSSDDIVRHARELSEKTQDCSRRAAQKVVAEVKTGSFSTDTLAKLIQRKFEELNQ